MRLADAIETISNAVVTVGFYVEGLEPNLARQLGRDSLSGSFGTGFFVGREGYVVTARHVMVSLNDFLKPIQATRKQTEIGIAWPNIDKGAVKSRQNFHKVGFDIIDEDATNDLVLLKLKSNPFNRTQPMIRSAEKEIWLQVGEAILKGDRPRDGEPVAISGFPFNEKVLVTTAGWIASAWPLVNREKPLPGMPLGIPLPENIDFYLADVTANPGNSGGPVYSIETGHVIGVCQGGKGTPIFDEEGKPWTLHSHSLLAPARLTIVIPARYVTALLEKHHVKYSAPAK